MHSETSVSSALSKNSLGKLPFVLIGIDKQGRICSWSGGKLSGLETHKGEIEGKPFSRFLESIAQQYKSSGLEGLIHLIEAALDGGTPPAGWQFDFYVNGKRRLLQADFSIISKNGNGSINGGTLVLQDVTDLQRLEDDTYEISRLANLGQLAASVAHEVRNPLGTVKIAAQLLSEESNGNSTVTHYAEVIKRETRRLEQLVSDFLRYARLPNLQLVMTSSEEVIDRSVYLLQEYATEHGVNIKCSSSQKNLSFRVDFEALVQVLLNIGRNAIEASTRGGKILLEAYSGDQDSDQVFITIQDSGEGIPRRNLVKVCEPFYTTKEQGTGLGLSIAKKIVEAHGGELKIKSRLGQGTRAIVVLPGGKRVSNG